MNTVSTINLTSTQRTLLVRIYNASTPKIGYTEATTGESNIAASRMLTDLKLISLSGDSATVTDAGKQLMVNEGLLDKNGQLTDVGTELASDQSNVKEQFILINQINQMMTETK